MNIKRKGIVLLSCLVATTSCLLTTLSANNYLSFNQTSSEEYNLTIDKDSGVTTTSEFAESNYVYNSFASFVFSSIKSADDSVGLLEANSTIVKNEASNGLESVNLTFSGGDIFAYSRYLEDDLSEIKYALSSGVEQTILGNYVRFEVGDDNVTLSSLCIKYSCEVIDDKPSTPLDLLPAVHNTLRIEAESAHIVDAAEAISTGIEDGYTIETTNYPSGDSYVYGLSSATKNSFTSLTFFVNASEAGYAILSFGLGLNTARNLENMWTVELNGAKQNIFDSDITCPAYSGVQYFDWTKISAYVLNLDSGINTITLYLGTVGALNFDYIELDSELTLSQISSNYTIYDARTNSYTNASSHVDPESTSITKIKPYGYYESTSGKTFTFEVYVDEAATAKMLLLVARNKALAPASNLSSLTLNGSSNDVILENHTNSFNGWYAFYEASYALLKLKSGSNTISFGITSGQSTNTAAISFISTSEVKIQKTIEHEELTTMYGSTRGITTTASTAYGATSYYQSKSTVFTFKFAITSSSAANVKFYLATGWATSRKWKPAALISTDPDYSDRRLVTVNGYNSSEYVTDYNLVTADASTGWTLVMRYFVSFNLSAGTNIIEFSFASYNWNFGDLYFIGNTSTIISLCAIPE